MTNPTLQSDPKNFFNTAFASLPHKFFLTEAHTTPRRHPTAKAEPHLNAVAKIDFVLCDT